MSAIDPSPSRRDAIPDLDCPHCGGNAMIEEYPEHIEARCVQCARTIKVPSNIAARYGKVAW